MVLDFFKKMFRKERKEGGTKPGVKREKEFKPAAEIGKSEPTKHEPSVAVKLPPKTEEPVPEKSLNEKSDDDLAKEINEISPKILSQAKTPEQRKMVIDIYRMMLKDGVDINDEKEVKKWFKKHPEVFQGGEPAPKVETYRRKEPKVGRNDPCPCGSGKKYKKCCGKGK